MSLTRFLDLYTAAGSISVSVAGVAAAAAIGSVTVSAQRIVTVTTVGFEATGGVGSVTVATSGPGAVINTGVAAAAAIGSVTVSAQRIVTVTVIGLEATGRVGFVTTSESEDMITSGSRNFNIDVGEIIEEAYERCGLEVRSGYDAKTARRSLNLMFADWANRGLNLWTVEQATLTLTQGQAQETLGADVVDILEMVLRRNGTDYEMDRISRGDYLDFPNKTDQGRPSQFYFNRSIQPVINLWQAPENSTDQLVYYYVRRIEDADALTNATAVPFRFYPCMVAGLAYYLATKRAPERLQALKAMYDEEFMRAAEEDEDRVSLMLRPDGRQMSRG